MTTHILLDIDGVINAVLPTENDRNFAGHTGLWSVATAYPTPYTISWSHDVVDYLNDLLSKHHLVIASTWRKSALEIIFPLVGLNVPEDVTVLDPDTEPTGIQPLSPSGWWKMDFVKEFVSECPENDRFVWIDDDHDLFIHSYDYASSLDGRMLIVSPIMRSGLTVNNLKNITEFINGD